MYLHQLTPSVILLLSLKYGAKAQDFSFIPPEAGEVANFNMQLFNDCLGVAQRPQCHPFVDHPVCIKNLCTNCKTYSKIIANCCSTGDPASCLDAQAGVADSGSSASSSSTESGGDSGDGGSAPTATGGSSVLIAATASGSSPSSAAPSLPSDSSAPSSPASAPPSSPSSGSSAPSSSTTPSAPTTTLASTSSSSTTPSTSTTISTSSSGTPKINEASSASLSWSKMIFITTLSLLYATL